MPFPTFKTKDEIPEAFRDEYEERDGEWRPKAAPKADDADALRETLRKERERADTAEKEAKRLAKERADADLETKARKGGVTDDQLKQIRADVRAELEKEYEPFKADSEKFKIENRTLKLDNQVRALAAKLGVRSERLDAWWNQFGSRFDLTDDGKPMIKDKPGATVETYIKDSLKTELPEFYEGTQAAGGGAAGAQKAAAVAIAADDVLKNPAEALNAARSAGKTE